MNKAEATEQMKPAAPPELPSVRRRKLRKLAIIGALVVVIGGTVTPLMLHVIGVTAVRSHCPPYIEMTYTDIQSVEKIFSRDGREIVLIGMAHIGEPEFYDSINNRLADEVGLILYEGVKDPDNVFGMNQRNPYSKISKDIGLTAQGAFEVDDARMVWADVTASELDEETIETIAMLFAVINATDDTAEMMRRFQTLSEHFEANPGLEESIMHELVTVRNARLLEKIDAHRGEVRLFIPWGAQHLEEIEQHLLKDGYLEVSRSNRRIATFKGIYWTLFCLLIGR
jgi:hypothetical protein